MIRLFVLNYIFKHFSVNLFGTDTITVPDNFSFRWKYICIVSSFVRIGILQCIFLFDGNIIMLSTFILVLKI